MKHPDESDLALVAGGDAGLVRSFFLARHLRICDECQEKVAEFQGLRTMAQEFDAPDMNGDLNGNALAAEMRANISVGLAAGACVGNEPAPSHWNPRFAIAGGCLALLLGSSFLYNGRGGHPEGLKESSAPMARSTGSGIEVRKGGNSLIFLNHRGVPVNQTVSAEGQIRARYVDGETGSVTITNVYLEQ